MLNKEKEDRYQIEFYCIDDLVLKNHLLRKIEKAVDFKKIYALTDELHCKDNGRPNVDSIVLFKMVLIQHLYGLNSLRRTHEEIQMNIAYRWFLGYSLPKSPYPLHPDPILTKSTFKFTILRKLSRFMAILAITNRTPHLGSKACPSGVIH